MFGINGIVLPNLLLFQPIDSILVKYGIKFSSGSGIIDLIKLIVLGIGCYTLPNTMQLFQNYNPCLIHKGYEVNLSSFEFICWKPRYYVAFVYTIIFIWSVLYLNRVSEFLYFNF